MGLEQYVNKKYSFTATLLLLIREIVKDKNEAFLCSIFEKIEEHITMFKQKLGFTSSSTACRTVYRELDMFIEKERPPIITCREGCDYCCYQFVAVAKSEAQHLLKVARATGIPIDYDLVKRQAGVSTEEWMHLPITDQPCVFLDTTTRRCRVYRDRPLACRKYFVVGDPELCNINANPEHEQPVWYQLDAELVSTAWMTVDGCNSLPYFLLEAHNNENNTSRALG